MCIEFDFYSKVCVACPVLKKMLWLVYFLNICLPRNSPILFSLTIRLKIIGVSHYDITSWVQRLDCDML